MSNFEFNLKPKLGIKIETQFRRIVTPIPNDSSLRIIEKLEKVESRSMHGQLPIVWDRAKDFSVYDAEGNKWIDFTSTIFVANVGHSNARVKEYVSTTLENELISTYAYANSIKAEYCEKLLKFAGPDFEKVFLLSAGTEATDAAMKLMKLNGIVEGKKKNYILAISGNWHGRTMGAQLLSDNASQREWISSTDQETVHIPFPYPKNFSNSNSIEFLEQSISELASRGVSIESDVAGIMMETFQGWGAYFYPTEYVKKIREICDKYSILLCFDEMQAGFGRTGKNFGYQHYEIKADLICIGKGMGNGFPISGVMGSSKVMDLPEVGNMSSTHSGNPVCCSAGLAVLEELLSNNLVSASREKGMILHQKLDELLDIYPELISEIQGRGLIAAIIFNKAANSEINLIVSRIAERCFQMGLLVVHTGRESIKIGPPLTISKDALLEGISVLKKAVEEIYVEITNRK